MFENEGKKETTPVKKEEVTNKENPIFTQKDEKESLLIINNIEENKNIVQEKPELFDNNLLIQKTHTQDKNNLIVTFDKIENKNNINTVIQLSESALNKIEKKELKDALPVQSKLTTTKIKNIGTKVKMKDNIIKVNIEEIEKQYLSGEKLTLEGQFDPNKKEQMEKMREDLFQMHPRQFRDGKYVKYPLCTPTGWFCCGGKCGHSELEKLGIGMICYFKLLKAFLLCFLIITIFNIPLYYIYYNNHVEKSITNYRDALFKTTIGNIASGKF